MPAGHKQLALDERLRDAPSSVFDQTHVIFGGTGAVGGETGTTLIEFYERMMRIQPPENTQIPTLVITGASSAELKAYKRRLIELPSKLRGLDSKRGVYITRSGVRVVLKEFRADPSFGNVDLKGNGVQELEQIIDRLNAPFAQFLQEYQKEYSPHDEFKFASVICGIPLPSVATYYMNALEDLCKRNGISDDEQVLGLKVRLLRKIAKEFGDIKREQANEVLIAHTTAVGGMYDVTADDRIQIRLGFAHSSWDDLLRTKQRFADVLTEAYSNEGLKVLITAAAIGIDEIQTACNIPYTAGVLRVLKKGGNIPPRLLAPGLVRVFPFQTVTLGEETNNPLVFTRVRKGKTVVDTKGYELCVPLAIRSGENGLFSGDNALALYYVMKVATGSELAIPLASTAMLGDDSRKPWFDENGICYYSETENASLAFSLMANRSEIARESTNAFSLKAYQALGSAKHQASLHTLGLYNLLLRLKHLRTEAIDELVARVEPGAPPVGKDPTKLYISDLTAERMQRLLETNSRVTYLEDIAQLEPEETERQFALLMKCTKREGLCEFLGLNYPKVHKDRAYGRAIRGLVKAIRGYLDEITSLGTPIIYRKDGQERIRLGPYVAPLDLAMTHEDTIASAVRANASALKIPEETLFNWYVTNNGFIDLRAEARVTTAKQADALLETKMHTYHSLLEFRKGVLALPQGYFTSSGITSMIGRMQGLCEQLRDFDLGFGTHMNWGALFRRDEQDHILVPGVVEAVRMYTEGLGKTTGTESLYPSHGYFASPVVRHVQLRK